MTIAEEYLKRSRLFRRLKKGTHGQLVELYAASLVEAGLSRPGAICDRLAPIDAWARKRAASDVVGSAATGVGADAEELGGVGASAGVATAAPSPLSPPPQAATPATEANATTVDG